MLLVMKLKVKKGLTKEFERKSKSEKEDKQRKKELEREKMGKIGKGDKEVLIKEK